jgi:hypothetical protein
VTVKGDFLHSGERAATAVPRDYADRLEFRLPPFFRLAWATAAARDRWSGPLDRLAHEVRISEWLSVAAGLRLAALTVVPPSQAAAMAGEWSRRGLCSRVVSRDDAMQVRALNGKTLHATPGHQVHLVTRSERMEQLETIWRSADLLDVASWLGYPTCCAAFLKTVAVERRSLDTTWAMVEGDTHAENGVQIAELAGFAVNPLLSVLGLRAAPHRPCSFFCQETQRLALEYGKLLAPARCPPDHATLAEVLSWPVEWSSLHGIIEVRLPILKLCYDGDATATTYKVRLTGGDLPEQAAQGLEFLHRQPDRRRVQAEFDQSIK